MDHTLYVKYTQNGTTVVIVNVDDIVVIGDDPGEVHKLNLTLVVNLKLKI